MKFAYCKTRPTFTTTFHPLPSLDTMKTLQFSGVLNDKATLFLNGVLYLPDVHLHGHQHGFIASVVGDTVVISPDTLHAPDCREMPLNTALRQISNELSHLPDPLLDTLKLEPILHDTPLCEYGKIGRYDKVRIIPNVNPTEVAFYYRSAYNVRTVVDGSSLYLLCIMEQEVVGWNVSHDVSLDMSLSTCSSHVMERSELLRLLNRPEDLNNYQIKTS